VSSSDVCLCFLLYSYCLLYAPLLRAAFFTAYYRVGLLLPFAPPTGCGENYVLALWRFWADVTSASGYLPFSGVLTFFVNGGVFYFILLGIFDMCLLFPLPPYPPDLPLPFLPSA